MSELAFTNRELTAMFDELKNGNDRIEQQTIKHNGRMTKMERWQSYMMGAFSVLTIVIVPILAWALYSLVKLPETIQDALSIYELPSK